MRICTPRFDSMAVAALERVAVTPFEKSLEAESDESEASQERRKREGGDGIVLIVEDLHLERHGVGEAANVSGDDRDGAEFSHGARVAEKDAIKQRPFHIGQRDREEG